MTSGKILIYGRQAFASTALRDMIAKEFADMIVLDANSREGLHDFDPNEVDLVVVTTSAAVNRPDMETLSYIMRTATKRPLLAILGDIGFAAERQQAIMLNLRGVFPDNTSPATVLAGLRFILAGGTYFPAKSAEIDSSEHSSEAMEQAGPAMKPAPAETVQGLQSFTGRELAVLKALAKGLPNKAISRQLNIAENTIKIHVRSILRKLSCTNRTEAALLAQRHNLI